MDTLKFSSHTVRGKTYYFRNFSSITNDFEAYTIGYLAGDGGYIENRGFPFMLVSSTEKHIIQQFKEYWVPNKPIYELGKKSSEKVNAINDVYELRFQSKLSKKFNKYGIFCKKKDRVVKNINFEYTIPYIAGLLDADGHIQIEDRVDTLTPRLIWAITHRSKEYLECVQNLLEEWYVPSTIRKHGNRNCYRISCKSTESNKIFLNKLLPYMLNKNKKQKLSTYLKIYYKEYSTNE